MSTVLKCAVSLLMSGILVVSDAVPTRQISLIDTINAQRLTTESFAPLVNDVSFYREKKSEYKKSGMQPELNGLDKKVLEEGVQSCVSFDMKQQAEDNTFMALFEDNTGCNNILSIWDNINIAIADNLTYTISNGIFNESIRYGISTHLITTISSWLEEGLNEYHPLLSNDITYHILRWLVSRKTMNNNYFDNICSTQDTLNNYIGSTFDSIPNCLISFPKINCSAIKFWNKTFAIALQLDIELSFILGLNGGVGVGIELKNYAEAVLYYAVGGGLSLAFGAAFGIQIPFVSDINYLKGSTIRIGAALELGIWLGGYVLLNGHFHYVGYGAEIGIGAAAIPIVISAEYVYRAAIKQFLVNTSAICQKAKTVRPSTHPTMKPHSLRPSLHPSGHTTRNPSHPTPSPSHPTFKPPTL